MFELGICTVIGVIFMILVYLISRQLARFVAHINGTEKPKESVFWYVIISGVVGFIVGSLLQPHWDVLYGCYQNTGTWIQCLTPFNK
ncbi:MAG: hypothetical protein LZT29_00685 [Pantoea stewartii]|uniref:hypothetical protein n=1 Tax=Pantoea stewartii TaxID=66269 RepID=UPI0006D28FC1|nr:hypothetical protein [Pantoea stewartii]WHS97808.1 MAG: hypothetical protein LZT29_00685 [Pantoea stewartii]